MSLIQGLYNGGLKEVAVGVDGTIGIGGPIPGTLTAPKSLSAVDHEEVDVTGASAANLSVYLGTNSTFVVWARISTVAHVAGDVDTLAHFKPQTHMTNGLERWLPVDPNADAQYLQLLITDGITPTPGGALDIVTIGLESPSI